jgi:two-component system response regulator MprA
VEPERPTVVVIEDDQGVRESLAMVLEYQDHRVEQADSGEAGLDLVRRVNPSLVLLDVNLGGIDGFETCRRLRRHGFGGSVLMLTARKEVADRVSGLDAGADDYLPKPFSLDELLARVRALLRRHTHSVETAAATDVAMSLADLHLDPSARIVTRGESRIELTRIEFDLLELLVFNSPRVLSRSLLYEQIWGSDEDFQSNSLEVFISQLRKKTEIDGRPRLIHTVRGVGYAARHDR